ncbi:hypothetical protein E4U56_002436 [Claviceps arundinis]|uniref:Uncharacterized protein n=1 Tax=Claviceps arundinis TaxID=1623583 RepID=A0A9P7STD3_9HYPO|nr:hypothetical protein E4U56_002436 [Claviceps arundinis]
MSTWSIKPKDEFSIDDSARTSRMDKTSLVRGGVLTLDQAEERISDEASEDGDDIGDPSSADLDDEDPFEYLHQELWEFSTYITEDWYRLGDQPVDLAQATETELNGQIIYYLSEYMEYNLKG